MNKLLRGYVFRMYPNKEREILINKTIGCSRFIYNYALDKKKNEYEENHKTLSDYDLTKLILSLCNDYMWLKEIDSCTLRNSIFNLDNAYQKFYKGSGYPKFKSKGIHDSYKTNNIKSTYKVKEYNSIEIDINCKTVTGIFK